MDDRVLYADAAFDTLAGLLLLLAPWDWLYDTLDLPHPRPELFTQIAGGLFLGFAYLLWLAPRTEPLTRAVALTAAAANAVGAVLIAAWLVVGDVGTGGTGTVLLAALAALLAVFAAGEARIAARDVALLLPRD